jgi:hypothetical protein
VRMNAVLKAIKAQIPEGSVQDGGIAKARFITGCLYRLGFTRSRSGLTFERSTPPKAEDGDAR